LAALSQRLRIDGGFGGGDGGSAYILGQIINEAYVAKNVRGIASCRRYVPDLRLEGSSTYGHQVILSKISNTNPRQQSAQAVR